MKSLIVEASSLCKEITVPPSKSDTHRAILFASLAKGVSIVSNYLQSNDSESMINACRYLGADIKVFANHLEITGMDGKFCEKKDVIDAKNSGIILRFIAGIACNSLIPIVITGDESICSQRPMQPLINALKELGINVISLRNNGFAPLSIKGPIKNYTCTLYDGSDSQYVSALLIAASMIENKIEIKVKNPGEKPWVDMTINWLQRLGVEVVNQSYERYIVRGVKSFSSFNYTISGDWSSATFAIVAALITNSELVINNLDLHDHQGDKKILKIIEQMGAKFVFNNNSLKIFKENPLIGITVDINDCIDVITSLAVLACSAKGQTRIVNAAVSRQKECNRISCISLELKKMGAVIEETDDGLVIHGAKLKGAVVESYNDHRMAMSLSIAGLAASGKTYVNNYECLGKTYPNFIEDFKSIGANIQ